MEPLYHYIFHIFIRSESMTSERCSINSQYMKHHAYCTDSIKCVLFMQHDDTCHKKAGMLFYGNKQVMRCSTTALSTDGDVRVQNDSLLVLTRWILHRKCWHWSVSHYSCKHWHTHSAAGMSGTQRCYCLALAVFGTITTDKFHLNRTHRWSPLAQGSILITLQPNSPLKADSHIACRAHAVR
jgi:hypothetical protein